jgi:hypothetical protein
MSLVFLRGLRCVMIFKYERMLRSLLWMASACASLFLVRLKNSDTVNSFTLGINELMVDGHCVVVRR